MSNENLMRAQAEIKTALETATGADHAVNDPENMTIDDDTFKQIARPLRRALRLVSGKPVRRTQDEKDADLLYDAMNTGGGHKGEPGYEFAVLLDEEIDAANRVYNRRDFFTMMYLDAIREGKSDELQFVLAGLRKGADPKEIAKQLDDGRLRQ